MFGLDVMKKMNEDAMEVYRKTIPATLRLRNRLRNTGSTTVEQNRAIEALFNLLSPALQNVLIEADVKNEDLVPTTGFAPIFDVSVDYPPRMYAYHIPADNAKDAAEVFQSHFNLPPDLRINVDPSDPVTGLDYTKMIGIAVGIKSPHSS